MLTYDRGVDAAVIEQERNLTQLLNAKAQRQIQLVARKGSQDEIATLKKKSALSKTSTSICRRPYEKRAPDTLRSLSLSR